MKKFKISDKQKDEGCMENYSNCSYYHYVTADEYGTSSDGHGCLNSGCRCSLAYTGLCESFTTDEVFKDDEMWDMHSEYVQSDYENHYEVEDE